MSACIESLAVNVDSVVEYGDQGQSVACIAHTNMNEEVAIDGEAQEKIVRQYVRGTRSDIMNDENYVSQVHEVSLERVSVALREEIDSLM
eukprot:IDg16323t1